MTRLAQPVRTLSRLGVVAAAAGIVPAGAAIMAAPAVSAAAVTAVNCSSTNLQTAIDDAGPEATLDVTGTCSGNFTIDQSLTLVGHGNTVLDGQDSGTTLTVSSGATVRLVNVTVTHGNADGSTIGTGLAANGGGINNSGTLTVVSSRIDDNSAESYGGGIFNNSSATLTLTATTVLGNSSTVFGGGIYNENAMTLEGSSVSQNSAVYAGGGVFTGFGFAPVTIKSSRISDNTATAGSGGGVFNILDTATLQDSTVTGNTATYAGGGINDNAGTTTLDSTIVTDNTVLMGEGGYYGGGVSVFSGTVSLNESAVRNNVPDNCDPPGVVTFCAG